MPGELTQAMRWQRRGGPTPQPALARRNSQSLGFASAATSRSLPYFDLTPEYLTPEYFATLRAFHAVDGGYYRGKLSDSGYNFSSSQATSIDEVCFAEAFLAAAERDGGKGDLEPISFLAC